MNDLSTLAILYVEDEPELRDHIAYALRLHSDAVTTAANGKEALAADSVMRVSAQNAAPSRVSRAAPDAFNGVRCSGFVVSVAKASLDVQPRLLRPVLSDPASVSTKSSSSCAANPALDSIKLVQMRSFPERMTWAYEERSTMYETLFLGMDAFDISYFVLRSSHFVFSLLPRVNGALPR